MYMRVVRGRLDPSRFDELQRLTPDITAFARRPPGYQSYVAGVDRADSRVCSVSTFDTEEHARWNPDTADAGDLRSRLQAVGLQVESTDIFEVTT
jgi:hypothetical protein